MKNISLARNTPLSYVAVSMTVMLILTLLLWSGLQRFEKDKLSEQLNTEILWLGKQVEETLKARAGSIDRMAERWEYGGGTPRPLWTKDAIGHLRLGIQAIEWADPSGHVRWVAPEGGNEAAIGYDLSRNSAQKMALDQARSATSTLFSRQMDFIQGGQGVLLVRALSVAGRFDGYLISVINTSDLFAGLTKEVATRGYSMDVSRDGNELYRHGDLSGAASPDLIRSFQLDVPNGNWQLRLWPDKAHHHTMLSALALSSGLALTLLAGITFWFWGLSMQRARLVEQSNRVLHETAQQTQAILDNVADGVITSDGRGNIASFNRAATLIFGYSAAEAIGKNVSLLMPNQDLSCHTSDIQNHLDTGKAHLIGIGREVEGRRKDGSIFPLDIALSQIRREGQPLFIAVVRDITVRKQSEAALIEAKEEAEHASQAKSHFMSCMSHELRTPMNAILGFSQLMQMDADLPAEYKENVDEILKAGHHLLRLIDQVLHLAKIEEGNLDIWTEPVACADLIEECLDTLRPLAQRQDVHIEPTDVGRLVVRADRAQLKQVLINLLANAIKYNRPAGTVRVHAAMTGKGHARLKVSDTGPGIPAERMAELFQAFNRLDAEGGNISGSGIGLVISQRLMEAMGGKIGVDSEPGSGSTFWIELPAENSVMGRSHQ